MSRFLKSAGLTTALLAVTFGTPAFADGVEASDAWSRARMENARAGGAYVTLKNTGSEADKVIAAASPVAETVELHTHIRDGDVMRMRQVENIPLPPGETVMLAPGGLHVMLIGLKETLSEGMVFPVTLTFEHAPAVTVDVTVKGMGAMGSQGSGHGQGHGQGHGEGMKHGHDTMKK